MVTWSKQLSVLFSTRSNPYKNKVTRTKCCCGAHSGSLHAQDSRQKHSKSVPPYLYKCFKDDSKWHHKQDTWDRRQDIGDNKQVSQDCEKATPPQQKKRISEYCQNGLYVDSMWTYRRAWATGLINIFMIKRGAQTLTKSGAQTLIKIRWRAVWVLLAAVPLA